MAKVIYDIAITNDLQIGFFTRETELNADQAKLVLERLVAMLGDENITVKDILPVERHRDDPRLQVVHDLTHEHNHDHSH